MEGEEQAMELEALAAIYMDDYKRIDDGTGEPTFELQLVPVTGGENNHVSLCLRVTFPASYPETSPPILKGSPVRGIQEDQLTMVIPVRGIQDDQLAECEATLIEAAASEELAGTPMVYTLVEKAQAWLLERNVPETDMHTAMLQRQKAAADAASESRGGQGGENESAAAPSGVGRRQAPAKEGEGTWRGDPSMALQEGEYTPVTPETFSAWRVEYDAEQKRRTLERLTALAKKRGGGGGGGTFADGVLTGRQLFEARGAVYLTEDAGALDEGEADFMDGPREEGEGEGEGEWEEEEEGEEDPELLEAVGDAALFDDDEDLDALPDN